MTCMLLIRRCMIGVLLTAVTLELTVGALQAREPDAPPLLLIDGETLHGQLVAIDQGALTLQSPEAESPTQTLKAGEWLRWSHPVPPPPRPRVYFSASTCLVTKQDWSEKVPLRIEGEQVTIDSRLFGSVVVERQQVDSILLEAAKEPAMARRLLAEASQPNPKADRVWLLQGDLLLGKVVRFDGKQLHFSLEGQAVPIAASRIAAIAFAQPVHRPRPQSAATSLVGFADGSLLEVTHLQSNRKQLELTTVQGWHWKSRRASLLCFVQSLAPKIAYLSDLTPANYRHTPYFSLTWPLARNHALTGGPLTVVGHRYAKGLAMHSASRVVYRVPKEARQFCAEIALNDITSENSDLLQPDSLQRGSVVFRVYLYRTDAAGQGGLTSVYESPVVRGGEKPRTVRVDLAGAQAIVLVVDYADFGDEFDHANWLDARLVP